MKLGLGAGGDCRRGVAALGLLVLAASSAGACHSKESAPVRPPGLDVSEGRPLTPAPQVAPARPAPAPEPPTTYDFERPAPAYPTAAQNLGISPPPTGGTGGSAPTQPGAPLGRDLAAELSSALNGVTDCIDPSLVANRPEGKLVVSVTAHVLESGSIYRATIDAPGQAPAALDCLKREVLALKLREPVSGAPITVKGTAEVQVKAVPPKAAASAPAPPRNPNVARGEQGDVARPDQADLAGPP